MVKFDITEFFKSLRYADRTAVAYHLIIASFWLFCLETLSTSFIYRHAFFTHCLGCIFAAACWILGCLFYGWLMDQFAGWNSDRDSRYGAAYTISTLVLGGSFGICYFNEISFTYFLYGTFGFLTLAIAFAFGLLALSKIL